MDRTPAILSPDELLSLTLEPSWQDAEPGSSALIVGLNGGDSLTDPEHLALRCWLTRQAVPVIGVGEPQASALGNAVDLCVTTSAELDRAVSSIDRNPIAATVLVQVLRSTASLDVFDALAVESLAYATLQGGREFAAWLSAYRASHSRELDASNEAAVRLNRDGDRLDLVLNSPATRNALSVRMRDALTDAFELVAMDGTIGRVHVSANGPCFSSGGALGEFGLADDPAEAHMIRMLRMPARYLAERPERYTFHLHRACIGAGIELPAFAGRVEATADTFFQLPELAMGLIPGAGGCVSIPRRIGRQRTAYMAVLGKKIPAERALAWGLIDAIVD